MSVKASSIIKPLGGIFPIIEDADMLGGFRVVADVAARDGIPNNHRKHGMLVNTNADSKTWRLGAGLTNADWTQITLSKTLEQIDTFITTVGQTVFTLSQTPVDAADVRVYVNGVRYLRDVNFTVGIGSVMWLDVPFAMGIEEVQIEYEF